MNLQDIQQHLVTHHADAYIVTRGNMFLTEEATLDEENKIKELSGFTGSAGTLLIMQQQAFLLVDGRYELQAAEQVDLSQIQVICTTESIGSWLNKNQPEPLTILYDSWCHSIAEVDYWNRAVKRHHFKEDNNRILGSRLSTTIAEIYEHDIEFAGISADEKISYLTDFMNHNQLDAFFISEPDAITWLLNLRSDYLPNTPIIRAFALVDKSGEISLFANDLSKIEPELKSYKNQIVGLSFNNTPKEIYNLFKKHKAKIYNLPNPIIDWKAIKNPIELSGIKAAHLRDGVAVCKLLYWLEQNYTDQTELSVAQKLYEYRKQGKNFKDLSFPTISAFGPHGAIVHYIPTAQSNIPLSSGSVLLLDSGGQYLDGTTDITRTVALGNVNSEIKDSFTQVLKAHIAVASSLFPADTEGRILDSFARAALWKFGKDFNHGTGHGVSCYGNVHEAGVSLSRRSRTHLNSGQVTSIEPGYYATDKYGIRIENLATVVDADNQDFPQPMLKFEVLTMVPIDKSLINKYLLTIPEIEWLNNYHAQVFSSLRDLLPEEMHNWLKQSCSPL